MRVSLGLMGAQTLFKGDFASLLEVAKLADSKGIDVVSTSDHVVMSRSAFEDDHYAGGKFPFPRDFDWYEPIALLSAVAAVTKRVRLAVNVMIAPLRPTALLAKQLATLDVISNGRLSIGVGAGWQKQEFDACNIPFEGRFGFLEEQVEACRALWSGSPAAYRGDMIAFEDLYSHPHPVQGNRLPVWFGLSATERGVERIARLADGWLAPPYEISVVAEGIRKIRAAAPKYGRAPGDIPLRALMQPVPTADGGVDLDATFAQVEAWAAAGADEIEGSIMNLCRHADMIEPVIDALVSLKGDSH
jgi:probable F420-dependent oxidoreductase